MFSSFPFKHEVKLYLGEHKQAPPTDIKDQRVHSQRQKVANTVHLNFFVLVHVSWALWKPAHTAIVVKHLLFSPNALTFFSQHPLWFASHQLLHFNKLGTTKRWLCTDSLYELTWKELHKLNWSKGSHKTMKYFAEAYANGTAPTSKACCLTGKVYKTVEVMEILPSCCPECRNGMVTVPFIYLFKIRQGERGLDILTGN